MTSHRNIKIKSGPDLPKLKRADSLSGGGTGKEREKEIRKERRKEYANAICIMHYEGAV